MTKPALQVEGLPVDVTTKAFDVRVTVSGPVVPGEGLPDQPDCDDLHVDRDNERRHGRRAGLDRRFPLRRPPGRGLPDGSRPGRTPPPPSCTRARHSRSSSAYELVGEGMMQWAPDHEHVVANWDYTVEND